MEEAIIVPESKEIFDNEAYSCKYCKSEIEIFLIDNKNTKILFQCLNKNDEINHGVINITISDYINSMLKNTYLFDKCSICHICQNNKNEIFDYCTKCKKILCNNCVYNHDKDETKKHLLIKNNEKSIYCDIHPKRENVEYCLDCKTHLCHECLKSRVHVMHRKNNLLEIKPSEKEINLIKEYIDDLKKEKENLEKERDVKLIDLKNNFDEEKINAENLFLEYVSHSKQKLKDNIFLYKKHLKSELEKIKKEYITKIKLSIDRFNIYLKNLENKTKLDIEEYKKYSYKKKLDNIRIKYNNDYNSLLNYYNKNINDVADLLNINKIVNNTYLKYENNYYNNINFLTILSCSKKSIGDNNIYQNLNLQREEKQNLKKEIEKLKAENLDKKKKNIHLIEQNEILKKEKKEYLSKYNELQDNIKELQNKNLDFSEYQKELNEILVKSGKNTTKKIKNKIENRRVVEPKNEDKEKPKEERTTPRNEPEKRKEIEPQKIPQNEENNIKKYIHILFGRNKNEDRELVNYLKCNNFDDKNSNIEIKKNEEKQKEINQQDNILFHIKKFRDYFSLSIEDYSDKVLLDVLKKANFNYEDAFQRLFV